MGQRYVSDVRVLADASGHNRGKALTAPPISIVELRRREPTRCESNAGGSGRAPITASGRSSRSGVSKPAAPGGRNENRCSSQALTRVLKTCRSRVHE